MISVVIPAYNEEKYIAHTLKSIKEQDFDGEYEIVVVDNASTDRTGEIAKEYADVVVYEKQKGVGIARDCGWRAASGEIIAYTDADSMVSKNWLSEIKKGFEDENVIAIYGPVFLVDGGATKKWMAKYLLTLFLVFNHIIRHYNIIGSNFAVRKKSMQEIDGFDTRLKTGEDIELALRLKRIGGKIVFTRKLIVYVSARRFRAGWISFLKYHTRNYLNMLIKGKTSLDMEDIR
jgi:glycosyltransferase involved in cell wall biosynthesis